MRGLEEVGFAVRLECDKCDVVIDGYGIGSCGSHEGK